ncbi:hypothetical protein PWT90_05807 [Aphanocladium album]|nr:hypothetical protein PWT90_05807 [Aphanocladium album]
MKLFSPPLFLALGTIVTADDMNKRDLSVFVDALKGLTADFVAADNAIVGVASQLRNTRNFIQSQNNLIVKEGNLTKTDTWTMLQSYPSLKNTVVTAMDHLAQRRDVILKSSECKDISDELNLTWFLGTLFVRVIASHSDPAFQPLASAIGDDISAKLKEQKDALQCPRP